MTKRRAFLNRLGIKLIAVAAILIGVFIFVEASFRPIIEKVNSIECHKAVSDIINRVVLDELEIIGADYSSLVTLSLNSGGDVTSVQSNIVNINRLKTSVTERVEKEIAQLSDVEVKIPIGTLSGLQLLHGKGFCIGMTVKPIGYASTSIISEFSEAGLNQTLHRIVIEITAEVDAVIPGFETRVEVTSQIIAAETVIVGKVPDAYTHVVTGDNGNNGDIAGLINDYGADNFL